MKNFNIMLSCAGRRVSLMHIIERSLGELGLGGKVLATDAQTLAPAFQAAKHKALVPLVRDPKFIDVLLDLCDAHEIRCIIPTIDTELPILAENRARFLERGVTVMVSSPECIALSNDKRLSHRWFVENDFPTFKQANIDEALKDPDGWEFPVFVKPYDGARSIGARRIDSLEELSQCRDPKLIVQSLGRGVEVTVDAFVDSRGNCVSVVPRQRLEVRDGEVSKGITLKSEKIMRMIKRLAERLPGAYGTLCTQVFYEPDSEAISVMEINPRFGGGYPLTDAAGAHFVRYLIEDILDLPSTAHKHWQQDLVMLRYDEAVFVEKQ
ncbi:MAG: ATP-grasp domain-containing protein [Bradymonadia bacterium]|jgi:carbamoyl-phosphate synthase large subunit